MSDSFTISNGVRQDGILSPKLFAVYLYKLTVELNKSGIGCHVGNCMNHLSYADDLCLLPPTAMALQQIINVCYGYSAEHDIYVQYKEIFLSSFKSKKYKLSCPTVSLAGAVISNLNSVKYLKSYSDWQSTR